MRLSLHVLVALSLCVACALAAPKRGNKDEEKGNGNSNTNAASTSGDTVATAIAGESGTDDLVFGMTAPLVVPQATGGPPGQPDKDKGGKARGREVTGAEVLQNVNKKSARKDKGGKVAEYNKKLPPGFAKPSKHKLSDEDKNKMKSSCGRKSGGCNKQSEKAKANKAQNFNRLVAAKSGALKRRMGKQRKAAAGGHGSAKELAAAVELSAAEEAAIEAEINAQMAATYEAKKALLKAQNISEDEIVPDDDGLWQGDLVLTAAQATRAAQLALADPADVLQPPPLPLDETAGGTSRRTKRWSLYLEAEGGALWTKFPIKYYLDDYFSDDQMEVFRLAISDIMNKTCVRFEEVFDIPDEPYIFFIKETAGSACGASNIGRTGDENLVWINFNSFCVNQIYGTIIHETLHALGVEHQHTRYDRNAHVAVLFDNIDPQAYDNFALADTDAFTSYGVPYDVFSIMHYGSETAVLRASDGEETRMSFYAAKEPRDFFTNVLGQRKGLSGRDADVLRKMYCMDDCADYNVWCGWWATTGYCESKVSLMIRLCPMSCDFCPNAVLDDATERTEPEPEA